MFQIQWLKTVLRTALLCVRCVTTILSVFPSLSVSSVHLPPSFSPGNKSCLIPLVAAGSEICHNVYPASAMAPSSFPPLPPHPQTSPFHRLHPWVALHTEWAVLSQCFSSDPRELWKTIKKAFCLRSDEGRRGRKRERERGGREVGVWGVDFQNSLVFKSCPDSASFRLLCQHLRDLECPLSFVIYSISFLIVSLM